METRRVGERVRRRRAPAGAASSPFLERFAPRFGRSFLVTLAIPPRKGDGCRTRRSRGSATPTFRIDTARRQAHLRRPVPERAIRSAPRTSRRPSAPTSSRSRTGTATTSATPSRSRSSTAATVVALVELAGWLGKQGVAEDKLHRLQQGRHDRRRRREVHADERVPLELDARRLVRAASRPASSSRPRTGRRSTSPATPASSATCS